MKTATPASLQLLFLVPFPPDLDGTHGGARAIGAIIETLSARHQISVLYLEPPGSPTFRQPPNAAEFIAVAAPPVPDSRKSIWARALKASRLLFSGEPDWVATSWSAELAEQAKKVAAERKPDVVHFELHVMGQYLPAIKQAAPDAALVITEHEPGIIAAEHGTGRNTIRRRLSSFAEKRAWGRFERQTLSRADAVITFTRKDKKALQQLLGSPSPKIECIPLRLPLSPGYTKKDARSVESDLLFIGNFGHPPNVDAAKRLMRQILPRVQQAIPSASLYLVGADPPAELLEKSSGVVVTGTVPEVGPYLRGAAVVVAPLQEGGGMRVKILEACAAGKAIIGSAKAVEGLSLRDGDEFIAAETDEQFAAAAVELLRNPQARERLGQAARAWSERTQDPDAWAEEYDRLYGSLLRNRQSPAAPAAHREA